MLLRLNQILVRNLEIGHPCMQKQNAGNQENFHLTHTQQDMELSQKITMKRNFDKLCLYNINRKNQLFIDYFLRRSMPAFLATASSPFFSMVFIALVDNRSLTQRLPASHQILLYCRLTNCSFFVLWFEWDTLFALLAFFPVKGHILPEEMSTQVVNTLD